MANGYSQVEGIDFHEVFALVTRYATVSMIVGLSVRLEWKRKVLDVKNTFPNANLEMPEVFIVEGKEDWVYRLWNASYGLSHLS